MNHLSNFWNWLYEGNSDDVAFQRQIALSPRDLTIRKVYADNLQDRDMSNDDTLEFLRFGKVPATFGEINGKIYAWPNYTMDEIKTIAHLNGSDFFSPRTMKMFKSRTSDSVFCGPGGVYFITSEANNTSGATRSVREYAVRVFKMYYEQNRHNIRTVERYPNLNQAKKAAQILSQTPK